MLTLRRSSHFVRNYKKLIRNNLFLESKIDDCLQKIATDPFQSSLKTHIVYSKIFGKAKSTSVSGDIRIIWDYEPKTKTIILLQNIGGHSGSKSVY